MSDFEFIVGWNKSLWFMARKKIPIKMWYENCIWTLLDQKPVNYKTQMMFSIVYVLKVKNP